MTRFETHEDIASWQKAAALQREVERVTQEPALQADSVLAEAMREAARAIPTLIAAGCRRQHRPAEFVHYLRRAQGAAGALRSHLYLALDRGHLSDAAAQALFAHTRSTAALLGGLIKYIGARLGVLQRELG